MKTYKNISPVEQLGIQPGETGEADIPLDQEQRMVARDSIEVVGDAAPATDPEETEVPPVEQTEAEKAAEKEAAEKQAEAEAKAKADAEAAEKAGQRSGGRR